MIENFDSARDRVYLRDAEDYENPRSGVTLSLNPARNGIAQFYDTKTGNVAQESNVGAGLGTVAVPDFVADIAHAIRYAP